MLFQVPRCSEDFTTTLTAARLCIYVHHLLVSLQEARLIKGRPTLTTLQLFRGALVYFEIVWVSVCSFTAFTAEPFVFFELGISDCGRLRFSGAPKRLLADGCPPFWSYELGYGRNFRSSTNPLRPLTFLSRFNCFSHRGLWTVIWIIALITTEHWIGFLIVHCCLL